MKLTSKCVALVCTLFHTLLAHVATNKQHLVYSFRSCNLANRGLALDIGLATHEMTTKDDHRVRTRMAFVMIGRFPNRRTYIMQLSRSRGRLGCCRFGVTASN